MRLIKMLLIAFGMMATMAVAQTPPAPAAPPAPDPQNLWHLQLSTGEVVVLLRPDKAPQHVERIKTLTRAGFYDGLTFHRVISGFMAQTGDPKGTGEGDSPLPNLKAEFNDLPHLRGTLAMARPEDKDGANSQFFICFQPVMRLDGKYTVFGRVISGMQFVDAIAPGTGEDGSVTGEREKIVHAWIEADGPNAARVPLVIPAPVVAPAAAAAAPEPAPAAPAAPEPAPASEAPKPN